jgi:protocatechuate 3,4-dioxygenase beta subunit
LELYKNALDQIASEKEQAQLNLAHYTERFSVYEETFQQQTTLYEKLSQDFGIQREKCLEYSDPVEVTHSIQDLESKLLRYNAQLKEKEKE